MSPSPEPSSLDDLEHRIRRLAETARDDKAAWASLRQDLEKGPFTGAPSPDPEAARRSGQELRLLTLVLEPHPSPGVGTSRRAADFRAGYVIEGERGTQEALVYPAFVEALTAPSGARDLPHEFPDLWAVDLGLWHQLHSGTASTPSLALQWLSSPGRRLLQEVSILRDLPFKVPPGAAVFSSERLREAAGVLSSVEPPARTDASWYELHTARPGAALDRWRPANEDVGEVLRILEGRRGEPVFMRGAALAWLLDRAASAPDYETMGLQRDLREDLLLAFLEGFPAPEDTSRHALLRTAARLEQACLLQAARLVPQGPPGQAPTAEQGWSMARWLQSCAFRSPFFGGDEESLAARLRALLPAKSVDPETLRDVLHPDRFSEEGTGLDIVELALVSGVACHYWPHASHPDASQPRLLPTPLPLVHALRRIANRQLNPGEQRAETLLQRLQESIQEDAPPDPSVENSLDWRAHHVAPPLVARWLMTHQRISWWEHVSAEVQHECLRLFTEDPSRYDWVAFVLYAEGSTGSAEVGVAAVDAWRRAVDITQGHLGSEGALALMGAGLLQHLPEMEATQLVPLAQKAQPAWRHRALEAIAEAAEKLGRTALWRLAMDALLEMCADGALDEQERLRAALLTLRRASHFTGTERTDYLQRLSVLATQAPFHQNVSLRRELRRLGHPPGPDPRGGR